MKVKLTKIQSNHSNLRTNEVIGETISLPEKGMGFILYGEPLVPEDGDVRIVQTTPVLEIMKVSDNVLEFKTKNSVYRLDVLENEKR